MNLAFMRELTAVTGAKPKQTEARNLFKRATRAYKRRTADALDTIRQAHAAAWEAEIRILDRGAIMGEDIDEHAVEEMRDIIDELNVMKLELVGAL